MTGVSKYIPIEFNYPNVCILDTIVQAWIYEVKAYGKPTFNYIYIDENNEFVELLEYCTPESRDKSTLSTKVS